MKEWGWSLIVFMLNVWNSLHPPVCTISCLHVAQRPCRPLTRAAYTQRLTSSGVTLSGRPQSNIGEIQLHVESEVPEMAA